MRRFAVAVVSLAIAVGACKKSDESTDKKAATETAAKVTTPSEAKKPTASAADTIPVTTTSEEARGKFIKARELVEWGHGPKAKPLLEEAVKLDPKFASATYFLSFFLPAADGEKLRAHAMELAKDIPLAERLTLEAAYAANRGDAAAQKASYEALLKEAPTSWRAQMNAAFFFMNNGESDRAVALLEKSAKANANNPQVYNSLAYGYGKQKNFEQAVAAAAKQVELRPKESNPYDTKGDIELMAGNFAAAEASFRKALEVDPSFVFAYDGIGAAQLYQGNFDGALATYKEQFAKLTIAAQRFGSRATELFILALSGKQAEAFKRTSELVALADEAGMVGEAQASLARGRIHVHNGDWKAAYKELKAATAALKGKKAPADQADVTSAALVWTASRAGDAAGAKKAFKEVKKTSRYYTMAKGHVEWASGDTKAALATFEGMKGEWNAEVGQHAAADLLASQKKTDEAKAKWTVLSANHPRDIDGIMSWYQIKSEL